MNNIELFLGIICLIQSAILYANAVKFELKDKLLEIRRQEISAGNAVISAGANYKKAAEAYIDDLEKKVEINRKAALAYKEKCERFERFIGSIPTIGPKN